MLDLRDMRSKLLFLVALAWATGAAAAVIEARPAPERCGVGADAGPAPPAAAANRLAGSEATRGTRNIAWAWLGSPTGRYAHDALGSPVHAASLHVQLALPDGSHQLLSLALPAGRVIEDRVARLADLDGDGRDEVILVESDARLGSSLVVYGLRLGAGARQPVLAQLARSPFIGTAHRWLNPVGIADLDGDGRLDIAAVTTPHIGGVLTLYRFQPPALEPVAGLPGFSNHRFGTPEQALSAIVPQPGQRPFVLLPGTDLRTLHALRIDGRGQWKDEAVPLVLPAPLQRIHATPGGACALLTNGTSVKVQLLP